MGAWLSLRAETNLIFSPSSQYLWRKLFDRVEAAPVANVADVLWRLPMSQLGLGAKREA